MADCKLRLQRATWSLHGAIAVLDKDFPAPQNESPHRNGGAAINQTAKRHADLMEVESDNEDGKRKRPGAHMEDASEDEEQTVPGLPRRKDDMPGLEYDSDEDLEVRLSDMPLSDVSMNPSSPHSCMAQERDGDFMDEDIEHGQGPLAGLKLAADNAHATLRECVQQGKGSLKAFGGFYRVLKNKTDGKKVNFNHLQNPDPEGSPYGVVPMDKGQIAAEAMDHTAEILEDLLQEAQREQAVVAPTLEAQRSAIEIIEGMNKRHENNVQQLPDDKQARARYPVMGTQIFVLDDADKKDINRIKARWPVAAAVVRWELHLRGPFCVLTEPRIGQDPKFAVLGSHPLATDVKYGDSVACQAFEGMIASHRKPPHDAPVSADDYSLLDCHPVGPILSDSVKVGAVPSHV